MIVRNPILEAEQRADRDKAVGLLSVSRETIFQLDVYVALLNKWNRSTNLVSQSSLASIWTRHIADCAQLPALAPRARVWLDIGSGAGFPGLVIAICLATLPGICVHCIESDARKAAFLRQVIRSTGAKARIHNIRVESLSDLVSLVPDAVTARALTSQDRLISLALPYLRQGATGIFPQGRLSSPDLFEWLVHQGLFGTAIPSRVDPQSTILVVRQPSHDRGNEL